MAQPLSLRTTHPSSRLSRRARWALQTPGTLSQIRGQRSVACLFFRGKKQSLVPVLVHLARGYCPSCQHVGNSRTGCGTHCPEGGDRKQPARSPAADTTAVLHPALHQVMATPATSLTKCGIGGTAFQGAPLQTEEGEGGTYLRPHVSRLALQTSAPGRALGRHVWLGDARQVQAVGVTGEGSGSRRDTGLARGQGSHRARPAALDRTRGTSSHFSSCASLPKFEGNPGQWRARGPRAQNTLASLQDGSDHGLSQPVAQGRVWTSSPTAGQDPQMLGGHRRRPGARGQAYPTQGMGWGHCALQSSGSLQASRAVHTPRGPLHCPECVWLPEARAAGARQGARIGVCPTLRWSRLQRGMAASKERGLEPLGSRGKVVASASVRASQPPGHHRPRPPRPLLPQGPSDVKCALTWISWEPDGLGGSGKGRHPIPWAPPGSPMTTYHGAGSPSKTHRASRPPQRQLKGKTGHAEKWLVYLYRQVRRARWEGGPISEAKDRSLWGRRSHGPPDPLSPILWAPGNNHKQSGRGGVGARWVPTPRFGDGHSTHLAAQSLLLTASFSPAGLAQAGPALSPAPRRVSVRSSPASGLG